MTCVRAPAPLVRTCSSRRAWPRCRVWMWAAPHRPRGAGAGGRGRHGAQGDVLLRLETDELARRTGAGRGRRAAGRRRAWPACAAPAASGARGAGPGRRHLRAAAGRAAAGAATGGAGLCERLAAGRCAPRGGRGAAQQASASAQAQANDDTGTDMVQARRSWRWPAPPHRRRRRGWRRPWCAPGRCPRAVARCGARADRAARQGLLSLALAGPAQLVAQVDERYLEQLQPGQAASVVADAFPGQRFAARVLHRARWWTRSAVRSR
jgi:HlyD family secretion protein